MRELQVGGWIPLVCQFAVKQKLNHMLEVGPIDQFTSPWTSPAVIVKKSNGDLRICIDYRRHNSQTVQDGYPLPKTTDTLDKTSGTKYLDWYLDTIRLKWP